MRREQGQSCDRVGSCFASASANGRSGVAAADAAAAVVGVAAAPAAVAAADGGGEPSQAYLVPTSWRRDWAVARQRP